MNEIECSEVVARIYEFHDGELSEAEADDIRQHLMACEPCLGSFEVERHMRALIQRSCNEQAPDSLRSKIVASFSRPAPA